MSYKTENELEHFDFVDSVLMGVERGVSCWHVYFSDVHILPDNSANRDIRTMRCNDLDVQILNGQLTSVIEEGYTLMDVNGNPYETVPDRTVASEDYEKTFEALIEAHVDSLDKDGQNYEVHVRDEFHTWKLSFTGTGDLQVWERFLNL